MSFWRISLWFCTLCFALGAFLFCNYRNFGSAFENLLQYDEMYNTVIFTFLCAEGHICLEVGDIFGSLPQNGMGSSLY